MVLVPREPTQEMIEKAEYLYIVNGANIFEAVVKAMYVMIQNTDNTSKCNSTLLSFIVSPFSKL